MRLMRERLAMKVRGSSPIEKAYGVTRPKKAGKGTKAGGASASRGPAAAASIMGIPEAELTPNVRDAMMTLMEEVDTLRRELEIAKGRIEQLASLADQDPLLPEVLNRRAFIREMSRVMSFAERYDMPASLVYFDLDGFKAVNDTHGHAVGDDVLRMVGSILIENVRDSDVVGRLGGDEFGVVLAKANQEVALRKATELARQIQSMPINFPDGEQATIESSFGAYTFQKGTGVEAAMDAADKAMYDTRAASRHGSD